MPASCGIIQAERKAANMDIERVQLADLKTYGKNTRVHDQRNREVVRCSLLEFGQYAPLVVRASTMEVLVGNCRLDEMRLLGWSVCDCVKIECDDTRAAAICSVDNRSAELACWDGAETLAMLNELTAIGLDVNAIGWDAADLAALVKQDDQSVNQDEGSLMAEPIRLTAEQWAVVNAACERLRADEGDPSISTGRCLELIAANFLSG
jgi:hypothetical protein